MKKLVFASNNKGKIKEVSDMLAPLGYEIICLKDVGFYDEIIEDGSSFFENSLIKAKTVFDFCHLPTIADDSGLMVDALGGAPGVYSARYSGESATDESNKALLLTNMKGVADRRAKFVTVFTYVDENGNVYQTEGQTSGVIAEQEIGSGGFGYDSLFISDDLNLSFGLATEEQKNSVSHRSRALKKMLEILNRE